MSERLRQMVRTARIRAGRNGRVKIAQESGLSVSTLVAVERDGHVPLAQNTYKLAKACGLEDAAALRFADECAAEKAKKAS